MYYIYGQSWPSLLIESTDSMMKGGAITCFQSEISLNATDTLYKNSGVNGGAVFSIDSKIFITGLVTFSNNNASEGGGVYLHQSEMVCQHSVIFLENKANVSGGGIKAVSSFIRLLYQGYLVFMRNFAQENGGGIFLTGNSKITVLRQGYTENKGILQNLDSGLWTGPWTGLWTGLMATITSYAATSSNSLVTTLTAFVLSKWLQG